MKRERKNGNKDMALQIIVFVTAILNLIKAIIKLLE